MDNTISVILTVYNQESTIGSIAKGIIENKSSNVKEVFFIIDGCTDNSEAEIRNVLPVHDDNTNFIFIYTPDLNEVLANNVGLKNSSCDYSIIVQDDCLIQEPLFDERLLKPFKIIPNLLAVSGRDSVDVIITEDGRLGWENVAGADSNTARNIFSVRDVINRGPLMLDNSKLKQLNYLDESFAPINSDDIDLCFRAYGEFGYVVGSYVVQFYSPESWGKTRNNVESNKKYLVSEDKNMRTVVARHRDLILYRKHSVDVIIE